MQQPNSMRIAEILLVEDNENDALLTKEGFAESHFMVNLNHVVNGKECLDYLRKEGKYKGVVTPDLILLDLNMPIMDGHEVLEEMSKDETLQKFRVVVLTTSSSEKDILDAYSWISCSSYIMKPVDFNDFVKVISDIGDYWLSLVVKPNK